MLNEVIIQEVSILMMIVDRLKSPESYNRGGYLSMKVDFEAVCWVMKNLKIKINTPAREREELWALLGEVKRGEERFPFVMIEN